VLHFPYLLPRGGECRVDLERTAEFGGGGLALPLSGQRQPEIVGVLGVGG
jgi:hypothetical protein